MKDQIIVTKATNIKISGFTVDALVVEIEAIKKAGADILVAGSAILSSSDYAETIKKLR